MPSYRIISQRKPHHTNSNTISIKMEKISHSRKKPLFWGILPGSLTTDLTFHSKKCVYVKQ